MDYPRDVAVDTRFGTVWVTMPRGDSYAHVSLSRTKYNAEGKAVVQYITCRGVDYGGDVRIYRHTDNAWRLGPEGSKGYQARQHATVRRSDWLSRDRSHEDATTTTFNLVVSEVVVKVELYLRSHPELLVQAQAYKLAHEWLSADSESEKAEFAYLAAKTTAALARQIWDDFKRIHGITEVICL